MDPFCQENHGFTLSGKVKEMKDDGRLSIMNVDEEIISPLFGYKDKYDYW